MTEFPQRPLQHVSEDVSIRVFQECMPATWVFRDQSTRNDYGVDAEVELVTPDGEMHGHIAKVQLKGKDSLSRNEDGSISLGGIKQTTLRYWLGLSRYANVIVAVTDNSTREAYVAPIFWQATKLLDGTTATKTIRLPQDSRLKGPKGPELFTLATIDRPWDMIRAHEELLRALPRVLHDFLWVFQADPWMIHDPSDVTQQWLRNGRALLGPVVGPDEEPLFDFRAWREKSERDWGDSPMYGTMREAYFRTLPLVFTQMAILSELVQQAQYFWSREALEYLLLVEATPIPERYDWDGIAAFVEAHKIEAPR